MLCAHLFAFLTDHGLGLVDEDLWRGRGTNCDLWWSQLRLEEEAFRDFSHRWSRSRSATHKSQMCRDTIQSHHYKIDLLRESTKHYLKYFK